MKYHFYKNIIIYFLFLNSMWQEKARATTELSKEEYEKNRVVVRVWHNTNVEIKKVGIELREPGHASVQLPYEKDNFVSFWPEPGTIDTRRSYKTGIIWHVPGVFNDLLIDDYKDENNHSTVTQRKPPNTIVCLYTLDAAKIQEQFLDFKQKVKGDKDGKQTGWALCGDCRFVSSGSKQHSCASLALALLKSGDLRDLFLTSLIPMKDKVSYSLQSPGDKVVKTNPTIVSPNNIANIVIKARNAERMRYKTIREIPLYENEIDLTDVQHFNGLYKEQESPYTHVTPPSGPCVIS